MYSGNSPKEGKGLVSYGLIQFVLCSGLPVEDRKKKRIGSSDSGRNSRKSQANPGKKGKKRRGVAYPSPHSDEEWIPGMSPDLTRKQKGKKSG